MSRSILPDGLSEIEQEIPVVMEMIARTARWVHPAVFRELPVWRPDTARKLPLLMADWVTPATTLKGEQKVEGNVAAQASLMSALGIARPFPRNWTTCHLWGYDDDRFVGSSDIVRDRRFFSCVANMVLLPTPLKGFTDAVPTIKRHLRVCAFHLYGWACEHPLVEREAAAVRGGEIPEGYPEGWPTSKRRILPPGTGPCSEYILDKAAKRKREIAALLGNVHFANYPREAVREVLDFWKVNLNR
ncbi:hypothetical protein [Antarcticirhabdus aurantiaca]|uniref:Uncharacterized protein n=1 Tax=Antarcticirhabdus aurantiaca TaxID=2606717 RepID=A0ACD4NNT5_9HYPH|nr:hypothetical protein [Antarcticirhabdus aurantiaca]WAJ28402.1 hypothetical protein OXU80_26930 [Jeongeuplla avenae]